MKIYKIALFLICSIGATSVLAQAQTNCPVNESYYLKREGSRIILNPEKSGVGQESVTAHAISITRGGEKIGVTITKRINLGMPALTPGVEGMYELTSTAFMPNGQIAIYSAVDADKDAYSNTVVRPVIGGTGKYAGARGTISVEPIKNSETIEYKLTLNIEVLCKGK